jgi:hypothetical protein
MKTIVLLATAAVLLSGCDQKAASADGEPAAESVASADPPATGTISGQEGQASKAVPSSDTGLCAPDEDVLFSCQLENRKIASVCGAIIKTGSIVAQYRYGKAGQVPELAWPEADSADRLKFASVPYSGGGEAQLHFRRGDTQYIVYSRVIRTNFTAGEPNDPALEDGIFVRKGDRIIARHVCDGPEVSPINYEKADLYAESSDDGIVELEY